MDNVVTIGTELDTKDFDREIEHLQKHLKDLEEDYDILSREKPFDKQEDELRKLSSQITQTKKKIQSMTKAKEEFNKKDFSNIQSSIQGIGSGIEGVTKKVTRWALAIFGIRSAYNFVRNSIATLSQYNEQMAVDVEYIRYLLASTLQPVIENLIQLAYKLLAYVNYIAKAWFGVNLFANASTEAFEKQNKSLGGSVKKAKELQKTLAGFDEMNILQDNGDTSSGGGGGGVSLPSFPSMEDIPIPSWIQWIVDHKDEVIAGILGITFALIGLKAGLDPLTSIGIGLIVAGIYEAIQGIFAFITDPTFENFTKILKGIALAITGVGLAFGLWPVAVAGAVALVIVEIVKHFDQIMEMFNNLISWLDENVLGGLRTLFGPLGDILYAPIKFFVELAKSSFQAFYGGIKQVIDGVIKIFQGDFWGGIKQIFGGLLNIMTAPLQGFANAVRSIVSLVMGLFAQIGAKVGEVIGGAFKSVINGVLSAIENILNFPIRSINSLIGVINAVPGINLGYLSTFSLPRLAKGGIINQPGRGVSLGSAIGGERGPEGVIPLTDSQQMEILGEAIGRYVTINANITNNMNGRTISRELQKIQNRDDFLYNR